MALRNVRQVIQAELDGRMRRSEFVKNITQTTTAGLWFDLSGSAGNPRAKQWFDATPLKAQQVKRSTDGGLDHGSDVSVDGYAKFLREIRVACATATPLPMSLILCDYLLYYPTIDKGDRSAQAMDNTATLPRYADGEGVQIVPITVSGGAGGQTFTVSYTNHEGTSGRTTVAATLNSASALGTVATSATATNGAANPFLALQGADRGVRSIESVTMAASDTGFFALLLVKPIAFTMIRGIDAVYEKDLFLFANEMPQIFDDAFLSFLALPVGSASGVAVRGSIKTVWS